MWLDSDNFDVTGGIVRIINEAIAMSLRL